MNQPPDSEPVSLERQINCVKREIEMRRMEIGCMEAVLATLHDMKLLKGIDNPDIDG